MLVSMRVVSGKVCDSYLPGHGIAYPPMDAWMEMGGMHEDHPFYGSSSSSFVLR